MDGFFERLAKGEKVNECQGIFPFQSILTGLVLLVVGSLTISVLGGSMNTALDTLEADLHQASQVQSGAVSPVSNR